MQYTKLGRTELTVSKTAFGALPIQRVDIQQARKIIRRACDAGITFFDTARSYSDSEEKIGLALADVRPQIVLATKTPARDKATLLEHIELSLKNLKTDYVDILQLHNPPKLPDPHDPDSLHAGLLQAQKQGKVRFIGLSNHKLDLTIQAAHSGLYDTIQFPISAISSDQDLQLIDICRKNNVGLIAMKALCGGLLTDVPAAFAFLHQFENVVPIWGIQKQTELDQLLSLAANPPALDQKMTDSIAAARTELAGDFCRACGYCLPCPTEIPIPVAARMIQLLRRARVETMITEERQQQMKLIENCTECRQCQQRCPYHLDVPALLKKAYADYQNFLNQA